MPAQGDCARTLAIAAWFAKYDPDQPRVPAGNTGGGRWTGGGTAGAVAPGGGAAGRAGGLPARKPALPRSAAALGTALPASAVPWLGRPASPGDMAALGVGARAAAADLAAEGLASLAAPIALGAVLIVAPSSTGAVADGRIEGHPEIGYHYDEDRLTVYRQDPGGGGAVLFSGWPGPDGTWRTAAGVAIGRTFGPGRGFLLNSNALAQVAPRAAAVAAIDARDDPRLCPDPGPDWPGGASEQAREYQQKVTGLPPGVGVELNGVVFDGCRSNGVIAVMLEAKGPGYAIGIDPRTGDWYTWYNGQTDLVGEMTRQSDAAKYRVIEWHVAEEKVAERLARDAARLPNVIVMYDPDGTGGKRVKWPPLKLVKRMSIRSYRSGCDSAARRCQFAA